MVILVTVITSWQSDLKTEGFIWDHCLRAQFTMTGSHSGQGLEAAGHIVSTVGK